MNKQMAWCSTCKAELSLTRFLNGTTICEICDCVVCRRCCYFLYADDIEVKVNRKVHGRICKRHIEETKELLKWKAVSMLDAQ